MNLSVVLVSASFGLALTMSQSAARDVGGGAVVRVVDGDTIDVGGTRFRLHGIDAPESGQSCAAKKGTWACGQVSTNFIEQLTAGKTVRCEGRGSDGYGRTIAVCFVGDTDINGQMVKAGMAWAYRKYSSDYVGLEDEARTAGAGVWQSQTEPAWDYRSHRWEAAIQQAPASKCPIKGNINRKNEAIYHVPWSKDYARTKIDASRGERWFCSEDEALSAGWRAPRWGSR